MEDDNENGPSTSNSFKDWSLDGPSHECCRSDSEINIDKESPEVGRSDSARSNTHPELKKIEQLANDAFGKGKRARKSTPRKPINKATSDKTSGSKVKARTSRAKTGRVTKRRSRRRPQRRRPKRRAVRYLSEDTILSSASYSGSEGLCDSCRHCACHRCFKDSSSRESSKLLLSPLLVKSYKPVAEARANRHCEVSPEMITAALKSLSKWRAEATTDMILSYIMANYPVCSDKTTLLQDLEEKLSIAVITGMVCCSDNSTWSLAPALRRRLSTSHVTRFWDVHCDMVPVRRKVKREEKPKEHTKKSTKKNN